MSVVSATMVCGVGGKASRGVSTVSEGWSQGSAGEGLAAVVEYVRALQSNAEALLHDADLLFSHQRWARAMALGVLALEEVGKAVLATSTLFPDDDLAELKATRHEDKLLTASLVDIGFFSDLAEFRADVGVLNPTALHREKLSALYVDHRAGVLECPSVTEERAEQVLSDARRVVAWLGKTYAQVSPEAIEFAQQLTAVLTPALDQYVSDHGEEAGLDVARGIVHWGHRLGQDVPGPADNGAAS